MTTVIRKRLLATTIIAGAVMAAAPAWAQTDSSAADNAGGGVTGAGIPAPTEPDTTAADAGDVVVTGSRIPQPNLESASPVTVLGAADVKQSGVTRVEDLINSLPQVFAGQGAGISNGATGTATLDLRGLGTNRTLVLINGRRVVPGDPASNDGAADVNLIPAALIKRVDVFTGGASSVYGADAVSGVVNFIMDTNFSGFRVDGQYSFFNHDNRVNGNVTRALAAQGYGAPNGLVTDGGSVDATVAFGAGFDDGHGHITAYAGYRKIDAVSQGRRDYSSCTLTAKSPAAAAAAGYGYTCGGSATAFPANFYATGVGYVDNQGNPSAPNIYNFGPTNYFQRPDERYTAGLFANYEVSEQFKPYLEFMFMDDVSVAQIAPSGDFFNTDTINCANPLASPGLLIAGGCAVGADGLPTGEGDAAIYVARRNVEGGGRRDVLRHTTYRAVIGAKGDLFKGVSYDAYYQYGRVTSSDQQENQLSISKLQNALNVVNGPNGPQCADADARDAGCVPWNIFTPGGVTPEALAYLAIPTFSAGQNTEQVANASVTLRGSEYGLTVPWASDGFGLNVGVEYRKETNTQNYDTSFSSGDIAGAGSAPQPITGQFNVLEGFVEASLPLVQDKPFFQQLVLNGGYRRSHYEIGRNLNSFNTDTYKGEVIWQPVRDLRLRATYNRAVRAPNVGELFLAQQVVLDGTIDPCALNQGDVFNGSTVNGYTQAQCALTGLSAAQFGNLQANPANQYNGLVGGNLNLRPEVADTLTAGFVIQPSFLRGFSFTADYFNIRVKDNIGQIGADTIIQQCLDTGATSFCNLINRDANGRLDRTDGFIIDTTLNNGTTSTSGVDVTLGYTQELGNYGSLGFNGSGTWLRALRYNPVETLNYNCSGYFGTRCGTPNPEWRHRVSGTYTSPWGPAFTLRWRYFSKVRADVFNNDLDLNPNGPTGTSTYPGNAVMDAQNYFDLAVTAPIGDRFTMRFGSNNLLDRQPPINALGLGVVQNGNTFAQVYDSLGRYIYAGITLDF